MTKQQQVISLLTQLNDQQLDQVLNIILSLSNGQHPHIEPTPYHSLKSPDELMKDFKELQECFSKHNYRDIDIEMAEALIPKYGKIL